LLLPAVPSPAQTAKIELNFLQPPVIQQRLEQVTRKLPERRAALESLFQEAGCPADSMAKQPIPHYKEPNVICTLAAARPDAAVIVVGGHYDKVDAGMGAVDDWSGAVLLPSLYESLKQRPNRHRFVFIGFAGEEAGLLGSREYVKKLPKDDLAAIRAMVNLECLGTSPPKVWAQRADKRLLSAYIAVVKALNLVAAASNVEKLGDDDSHPFLSASVPVITVHSITQDTYPVLHSNRDSLKAIHADDYYTAYRVTALYLAYLDSALE
jgi:hypothetical protein